MTSIQERLQLKRVPLDTWNIREQLCLASAVVRSGDQNWMSVSRSLKTIGDPNRPADWYSQKSCATQYGVLLENVETPKRKKRNSEGAVETPQECILKKLTQERIAEIQNTLGELNHQYTVVKNEVSELRDSQTTEDRVKEIWAGIEASKRTREKEQAKRAAWLKEREDRRVRAERSWRPNPPVSTPIQAISSSSIVPAPQPSSPLLSSLLKSSPVVTTPQHITHPANCVETISPSAGAPTLSMLLDKRSSTHDTEHAAIEHIKSEIVQLERQLKVAASNSPPPVPITTAVAIPTTVSSTVDKIDIDDIEIKAEDVYAFSDIDIEIPPVSSIHKSTVIREEPKVIPMEDETKKDEDVDVDTIPNDETSVSPPILITNQDVTPKSSDNPIEEETDDDEDVVVPEENNVTIPEVKFPEVKFPTAEIKVISTEPAKEIKKIIPEVVREVTKEDDTVVNVTDDDDSILPQDLDSSNEEVVQQCAAEVDLDSALENTPEVPEPPDQDQHVSESQAPTQGLGLSDQQNVQESEDKQREKDNEPPSNTTNTETQDAETEKSETTETDVTETINSDSIYMSYNTSIEPNKSTESNKTYESDITESNKCIDADKSVEYNKSFEADKPIEAEKPMETSISNEANKSIEADEPIAADKSIEADQPIAAEKAIEADKSVEADAVIKPENTENNQVLENLDVAAEKDTEVIQEMSLKEEIKKELAEVLSIPLYDDLEDDMQDDLLHTETDDDVPMELIREEEKDGKKKRDYSRKRKYESRTYSGSESAPDSPAPSETDKQHRMWKKSVMVVHNRLCAHKYASLFLRPITNDQAPNYDKIVKKPMDLSSIKKNIDAGIIRTTSEFRRCVLLMLSNALFYNSVTHDVHAMTKEMHKEADAQLGMLLQAQAHAELPPAPRHHKRRAHTHASKRPRLE